MAGTAAGALSTVRVEEMILGSVEWRVGQVRRGRIRGAACPLPTTFLVVSIDTVVCECGHGSWAWDHSWPSELLKDVAC
jgi:hypothetical protein